MKQDWIRLPLAALRDDRLGKTACCVLALLIDRQDYAAADGSVALTLADAAAYCGCSRRTAERAVAELETAGYIERHRTGRASRYLVLQGLPPKRKRRSKPATSWEDEPLEGQTALDDADYLAMVNRFLDEEEDAV